MGSESSRVNGMAHAALSGRCFANVEMLRITLKRALDYVTDDYLAKQITSDLERTEFVIGGFEAAHQAEASRISETENE